MNRRPRLLFLAYYFPPFRAMGCVRAWNTAKYLSRMGWDVTVVTPHPSHWCRREGGEQIERELGQEGIRRILTGHRWRCLSPGCLNTSHWGVGRVAGGICRRVARFLDVEREAGWVSEAAKACAGLRPDDVDLILATGSPFCSFGLARRLSVRLGRPYVLDYRDLWTGNPHSQGSDRAATLRQEARLLAGSAAITVVSESCAAVLQARFCPAPKLHVVTNGYDPEEMTAVRPHRFGHFAIVYTGSFYPPKRVILPVMAALESLKAMAHQPSIDWRFHYYGSDASHVLEASRQLGVSERTVLHGKVARQEALSAVRGAGVAVVITSIADRIALEDQGIVTGKLFEAVGLGTPTLLIAPAGSDAETVVRTTGLGSRFSGSDSTGIAAFLNDVMRGRAPHPLQSEIYSWPKIAQKMDLVLRSATGAATQTLAPYSARS